MTNNDVRYAELNYRKSILKEMLNKLEEENKNNAMIMLAQAFDKDIKSKCAGSLVLVNRWIKDIDKEIELHKLEDKIIKDMFESI